MKAIQMEGLQMNKTPYNVTHYRSVASDLLKICKLQHSAIDALFAMLIKKDKRFCPPDTGWIWKARSEGNAKIQETEWVIA